MSIFLWIVLYVVTAILVALYIARLNVSGKGFIKKLNCVQATIGAVYVLPLLLVVIIIDKFIDICDA